MSSHRFAPVLRELQPLSDRFAAAGHRLFLVGGTVRDIVLADLGDTRGDVGVDFDIDATTTARPDEIKRCLQGWADAVWTQGERFGTIGAMKRVPSLAPGASPDDMIERIYEITTHRAEVYQGHSRKPEVEFSTDIHDDLSRRDFTVNAMAIDVTAHSLDDEPVVVDPFGGAHDLRDRVLRTPLGPETSFSDDPLRMLRAARFITRYRLRPDAATLHAVHVMSDRMQIVSAERIHDELDKLLAAPVPGAGLRFVSDTGLLRFVVPELVDAPTQTDEPCHPHLWEHVVDLIDAVAPAPDVDVRLVRLAALLHPLGGPAAEARLRALRASNDDIRDVVRLIEQRASLLGRFMSDDAAWSDAQVRRFLRDVGALWLELHALVRAEAAVRATHAADSSARIDRQVTVLDDRVAALGAHEPLDDLGPQWDGARVMATLGLAPGPVVGEALAFLTDLRLDEGLVADDELHSRLEEWWSNHSAR